MAQRPEAPKSAVEASPKGAASGDVEVDDGDRLYVAEGDLVADKYRVERILGVGGVGFVVAARHVELGGLFALKFLKKRFLQDKAIVERFTREARAACRIKSEYVARVYDVGTHGRAPFLVMEHLVGRDLAAVLAEHGPFAVGDAVEYAVQACAALAVAHASGIVHRDIKPENLFVVDHEGLSVIKLLDFGISKIALASDRPVDEWGPEGEPITGTLTCGTPFYMSPEQIRSTATVDSRSDVWSLGMVLYELLAGSTAFIADSVADVCNAILEHEARWLSELRPEVPAALADVVARCLQKSAANRFANVAELAVALLPFAPPRALAIAEGSAWIRRAAIHSLGNLSEARVSGAFGAAVDPASTGGRGRPSAATPAPTGSPTPAPIAAPVSARSTARAERSMPTQPSLRPRNTSPLHRSSALLGGTAVVIALTAIWGATRLFGSHPPDGVKAAPVATSPAPPASAATPTAQAPPAAAAVGLDERPPSASTPSAAQATAPANVPAGGAHSVPSSRPRPMPTPHAPGSAKSAAPSAAAPAEPVPAPAVVGPPVAPGRPDLGY
jgi:serine/threonine-protein kinase